MSQNMQRSYLNYDHTCEDECEMIAELRLDVVLHDDVTRMFAESKPWLSMCVQQCGRGERDCSCTQVPQQQVTKLQGLASAKSLFICSKQEIRWR